MKKRKTKGKVINFHAKIEALTSKHALKLKPKL